MRAAAAGTSIRRIGTRQVRAAPLPQPRRGSSLNYDEILIQIGASRLTTTRATRPDEQLARYAGWIYCFVSLLSQDVNSRPWSLWAGDKETTSDTALAVAAPLARPSGGVSWAELAEISIMHLDLTGTAYWLRLGPAGAQYASGFQAIPPNWVVDRRYDASGKLADWKIAIPGMGTPVWIPADQIHQIRYPHPARPTTDGMSPVQAVAWAQDTDTLARAYIGTVLEHNGMISGFITTEQDIDPDDGELISNRWQERVGGGMGARLGPPVLGKGSKYQQLAMSVSDLEFAALAEMSMEQVAACYHVPPSVAGIALKGGTLAITNEHRNAYNRNALQPRLSRLADAVNDWLLPNAGIEGYVFRYESPIVQDEDAVHRRSSSDLRNGVITVNVHRVNVGEATTPDGDVYMLPAGVRYSKTLGEYDPLAATPFQSDDDEGRAQLGVPQSLLDNAQGGVGIPRLSIQLSAAEQFEAQMRLAMSEPEPLALPPGETRSTSSDDGPWESRLSPEQHLISGMTFARTQESLENELTRQISALFVQDLKTILAGLRAYLEVRTINKGVEDDLLASALQKSREAWWNTLNESALKSLASGWDLLSSDGVAAEFQLSFDVYRPEAVEWAAKNSATKIKRIWKTTREKVRPIIADGIENGTPYEDIAKELSELTDSFKGRGGRARTIARTETANAVNAGKYEHVVESERAYGIEYLKTWNPIESAETRKHHRAPAIKPSVTIPRAHSYIVDGQPMARPSDPRGRASNVINCRCTLTVEVKL